MDKDVRKFIRELEQAGLEVDTSGKGKPKVKTADGRFLVTLPLTPGDHRWKKNTLSELRRKGVEI